MYEQYEEVRFGFWKWVGWTASFPVILFGLHALWTWDALWDFLANMFSGWPL